MIKIFNRFKSEIGELRDVINMSYKKPFNSLMTAELTIKADNPAAIHLQPFNFIEVTDDFGEYIGIFRIMMASPTKEGDSATIKYSLYQAGHTLIDSAIKESKVYTNVTAYDIVSELLTLQSHNYWVVDGSLKTISIPLYELEVQSGLLSTIFDLVNNYSEKMILFDTSNVWTIKVKDIPTINCRIKEGYNLTNFDIEENYLSIINRVYAYAEWIEYENDVEIPKRVTMASVNNNKEYVENTELVNKYGVIETVELFSEEATPQELLDIANMVLKQHTQRVKSIRVSAVDMVKASTNDLSIDLLRVGNRVFFDSDDFGTSELVIMSESKSDIFGTPEDIDLEISMDKDLTSITSTIRNLKADIKGVTTIAERAIMSANGKNKVYYTPENQPPLQPQNGDIWFRDNADGTTSYLVRIADSWVDKSPNTEELEVAINNNKKIIEEAQAAANAAVKPDEIFEQINRQAGNILIRAEEGGAKLNITKDNVFMDSAVITQANIDLATINDAFLKNVTFDWARGKTIDANEINVVNLTGENLTFDTVFVNKLNASGIGADIDLSSNQSITQTVSNQVIGELAEFREGYESELNLLSNEINAKVSEKKYLDDTSSNLLINSHKNILGRPAYKIEHEKSDVDNNTIVISPQSGNYNYYIDPFDAINSTDNIEMNLDDGDEFTFSIDIKANDTNPKMPKVYIKNGVGGFTTLTGNINNDWNRVYYQGIWSDTNNITENYILNKDPIHVDDTKQEDIEDLNTMYANNGMHALFQNVFNGKPVTRDILGYGTTPTGDDDIDLPIYIYRWRPSGADSEKLAVFTAGIHGNEKIGIYSLYKMVKDGVNGIGTTEFKDFWNTTNIDIIPIINPYGFNAVRATTDEERISNLGRYNARGVDLNRNFAPGWSQSDISGSMAESEKETIAMVNYFNSISDKEIVAYFDFHTTFQFSESPKTPWYIQAVVYDTDDASRQKYVYNSIKEPLLKKANINVEKQEYEGFDFLGMTSTKSGLMVDKFRESNPNSNAVYVFEGGKRLYNPTNQTFEWDRYENVMPYVTFVKELLANVNRKTFALQLGFEGLTGKYFLRLPKIEKGHNDAPKWSRNSKDDANNLQLEVLTEQLASWELRSDGLELSIATKGKYRNTLIGSDNFENYNLDTQQYYSTREDGSIEVGIGASSNLSETYFLFPLDRLEYFNDGDKTTLLVDNLFANVNTSKVVFSLADKDKKVISNAWTYRDSMKIYSFTLSGKPEYLRVVIGRSDTNVVGTVRFYKETIAVVAGAIPNLTWDMTYINDSATQYKFLKDEFSLSLGDLKTEIQGDIDGLTLSGSKITLTGDTVVNGSFKIGANNLTEIGGFTITNSTLTSGSGSSYIRISGATGYTPILVGGTSWDSAKFAVSSIGTLKAEGANISGTITAKEGSIGYWNIDSDGIYRSGNGYYIHIKPTNSYPIFFGADANNSRFRVSQTGTVLARAFTLEGGKVGGTDVHSSYMSGGSWSSATGSGSFGGSASFTSGSYTGTGRFNSGMTVGGATLSSDGTSLILDNLHVRDTLRTQAFTAVTYSGANTTGGGQTTARLQDGRWNITNSDIRLKENISSVENEYNEYIYTLPIIKYNYINDNNKTPRLGVNANYLMKTLPEDMAKSFIHKDDLTGYYGVNYEYLTPYLVKVVQEQNERIKKLEEALNG